MKEMKGVKGVKGIKGWKKIINSKFEIDSENEAAPIIIRIIIRIIYYSKKKLIIDAGYKSFNS